MAPSTPTSQAETNQQIAAALQAGDISGAQQLLDQLGQAADPRILAAVAGLYMRQSLWSQAAATFDRIGQPDLSCRLQRQLAVNLAALEHARSDVYKIVVDTAPQTNCEISQLGSGRLTIGQTMPGHDCVSLSRGREPNAHAQQLLSSVASVINSGAALLLAGIGDGYLLHAVANALARHDGDMLATTYLIEPDPEVMIHTMMIHDYTGPRGPIECENFRWFVGPGWAQSLRRTLLDDPFMPDPSGRICLSLRSQTVMDQINQVITQRQAANTQLAAELETYYSALTGPSLAEQLGPTPPRPRGSC